MLHAMAAVFFADFLFGGIKRKPGWCRAQRLRFWFLLCNQMRIKTLEPAGRVPPDAILFLQAPKKSMQKMASPLA
jgi:hypothetical protein